MKTKLNYPKALKLAIEFKSLYRCKVALFAACMIFSFSTVVAHAQNKIAVHGNVTDASKSPIVGATVVIKGTTTGLITDADGKYSLDEVPSNAVLVFSFMGMVSQEVPVGGQKVINVVLQESDIKLDEVVAIGYGTQTKKQVSGSIANVTDKEFNKGVMSDASGLLKGKVAGLNVSLAGGDVTKKSVIRMRGTSSLSASNDPLVVIDGIPGMSMDAIAPGDIASISVLKDASASAIYGSRGANGVIMITSKKGSAARTQIVVTSYLSLESPAHVPNMLSAQAYRDYATDLKIHNDDNGANTNWFDAISRQGVSQQHNVTMSGGAGNHNYIATVNFLNRKGVILNNDYNQMSSRFSFTQRAINDKLKLTFTGIANMKNWNPINLDAFMFSKSMRPTDPIYNKDGSFVLYNGYGQAYGNPVSMLTQNNNDHESMYELGNANASFEIIDGLKYNLILTRSMEKETYGTYANSNVYGGGGWQNKGLAKRGAITTNRSILESNFNYNKTFKQHHINAMIGYSYEKDVYDDFSVQNRNFTTNEFTYNNMGAGSGLTLSDVASSKNMFVLIGMYARMQYDFKGRYFLTATVRQDGSSKFGDNNKWGTFPSVSAAWSLKDESFLKDVNWLSDLKLRAGWGQSGNQGINPYQSIAPYTSTGTVINAGSIISGYQPKNNANNDLKWETTTQTNVGIDYSLFKDRVSGSIDYYNKETDGLLGEYAAPMPPYLYDKIFANVGSMVNKGVEFLVNVEAIKNTNFKWNVSLNVSSNQNKVKSLSNSKFKKEYIQNGANDGFYIVGGLSDNVSITQPGYPVGEFFGYKYKGIDANGKWVFDSKDPTQAAVPGYGNDYTYLGSPFPKFSWGLTNTFNYKNIDLTLFFRGTEGNKIYNLARAMYENPTVVGKSNVYSSTVGSKLRDDPKASSYYVEDGSFARLENLTIGYTFNMDKMAWISKFRLYFTGQNLLLFTKYSGTDPEVPMDGVSPGVELPNFYPKTKMFTFGLNATF